MLVLMMILTIIVVSAFFAVLAGYLYIIGKSLDAIGGSPDSYLAKLRLGLRAIEQETGHSKIRVKLGPDVYLHRDGPRRGLLFRSERGAEREGRSRERLEVLVEGGGSVGDPRSEQILDRETETQRSERIDRTGVDSQTGAEEHGAVEY